MIRGTTPLHTFTLPIDTSEVDKVRIIYSQRDKPIIKKTKDDCTLEGKAVKCRLTQTDTFNLDHRTPVDIQVRVLRTNGVVLASRPITRAVENCNDDEEI